MDNRRAMVVVLSAAAGLGAGMWLEKKFVDRSTAAERKYVDEEVRRRVEERFREHESQVMVKTPNSASPLIQPVPTPQVPLGSRPAGSG